MEYVHQMQAHYRTYITACHILHHQRVLSAEGDLSFRHPTRPDVFIMPRNLPAACVASESDLMEYSVTTGLPLDPTATVTSSSSSGTNTSANVNLNPERFIHSEIYKQYPRIHSVLHSHSPTLIPYTITRVRLRPCTPSSSFLRACGPPVFDAANYLPPTASHHNLLITSERLGRKLAYRFSQGDVVALMRGHGFTVVGGSVEECVWRGVQVQRNAEVQTAAMGVQADARAVGSFVQDATVGVHYLSKVEAEGDNGGGGGEVGGSSQGSGSQGAVGVGGQGGSLGEEEGEVKRAWELWEREVKAMGVLYVNSV